MKLYIRQNLVMVGMAIARIPTPFIQRLTPRELSQLNVD